MKASQVDYSETQARYMKDAPMTAARDPYDAIKHATHLRVEADRMHHELLQQCEMLMHAQPGTQEAADLARLSKIVADYEEVRWDLDKATAPMG